MRRSLVLVAALLMAGCLGAGEPAGTRSHSSATAAPAAGLVDVAQDARPVRGAGGPVIAEPPQPFAPGGLPLEMRLVIDSALAGPEVPFQAFDTHALNLADLDGDGRPEAVSLNDNQRAYVIDPRTGKVLAELATPRPDGWDARDLNGVAIGDVDGDGQPELAVLNGAASLTVFRLDRAASTAQQFRFDPLWQANVTAVGRDPRFYETHPWLSPESPDLGADGNPFIVHLADGQAVILAQSDGDPAHLAFDADGGVRWLTSWWDGNSGPWAGRLTPGGPVRAVFATDGGHVVAYDVASGTIQWVFDARAHGIRPGSIPIMPAVVDLRGDGNKSIFVGARVAVQDGGADWMQRQHARYLLLDAAGKLVWDTSFEWGNPLLYADPAVLDVDGDGVKDIVALDWNTIGHNPGQWNKTGPANLFALDGATGRALWHRPLDAQWSNTGLVVASFVPGLGPLVLTEEQRGGQDGLSFVALDGARVGWMPLPAGWTVRRGPALADTDGDGLAEVVVPVSRPAAGCPRRLDVGCREGALLVYGSAARMDGVLFDGNPRFAD